jgi:threonine dehydrogenase-like Zn-dependent dehydrogenase
MAKIPDRLTDEQVLLLADIASTGFSAVERAEMQLGDTVVIMGQGPIGLCATMGARIRGAGFIIAVDPHRSRRAMALRMGADVVLDPDQHDIPAEIQRLTAGRGVDLAIEAVGEAITFETALRCLRPGGTLSSLGVYSTDIRLPLDAFAAGLGDYKIVSTLCPGGKERMYRLMELVLHERMDLTALLTHSYRLDEIVHAYELFTSHKDGVLKIAIRP